MKRARRSRPSTPSPNAAAYDLSDPAGAPPPPERVPRVGAWLGMSGAILTIVAMCMPWKPGKSEMGWDIPMVLLFSPLFFVSAPMLAAAIAIGVVCGRVTRNDPLYAVSAKSTEVGNTFAILGVAVLGLRVLGLIISIVRDGVAHSGVGAYFFLIGATLAVVGVFGAIYKRY